MNISNQNEMTMLGIIAAITLLHLHLIGNNPRPTVLPRKMFLSYTIQLVIMLVLMFNHYNPETQKAEAEAPAVRR